ncbi:hypothetical protein BH10PLA2_BH10PLA2_18500 [soil metagenome]
MSIAEPGPTTPNAPALNNAAKTRRMLLIGVLLALVIISLAYVSGWLSPQALTPSRFVDGLEQVDGHHSGFRRNHARGLGCSGWFESNGKGVALSRAGVFPAGRIPIIGRFSLGGGMPYAADAPKEVRGLKIQFTLPNLFCVMFLAHFGQSCFTR